MNDFSVNYDVIDKSNILKIHKYLMLMNNIKRCLKKFLKMLIKIFFIGSLR